ncbi:UNKNOWN [Stylonychia lemnae]|uniref:Uncharacterized protein n=1 Tax=Stylonychia lemnae TaxID=5949 RepID=A0A078AHA1_STYLE|nr:UNKNOWN [Stylonychia lemnae]|eukprot:CDW81629.1 UNKNOWN [Stylonychia lemnae]
MAGLDFNNLDLYLNGNDEHLSAQKEQDSLNIASLMNDINNIRVTQQSYGMPAIGDLFRAKPEDIQESINSIFYMLKQRVADLDFRQEARQKWSKLENDKQEFVDQNNRLKQKIEQLQSELKDAKIQIQNQDQKFRQEKDKFALERENMLKDNQRLLNKQTAFQHELNIWQKANKVQINGQMENKENAPLPNNEIKFSRIGGDSDFNLMIAKNQEEIQRKLCDENAQLKECLKQLQRELFDIVDIKTEIYLKRYRSEFPQSSNGPDYDNEEVIRNEIERIREELFNLPFQESGQEIIAKFQNNFTKLKDFMEKIDKEVAQLSVFNEKNDTSYDDVTSKFSGITSIQQLKLLLRNYDALVEGQHQLLNQSITKMAKIPPPDEISSTFNRFQILKDSELDEMRNFLNENKSVMQQQYKDFELEKKSFDEMTNRMEHEKQKISEERERIEAEVRKIKELNQHIQSQLFVSK